MAIYIIIIVHHHMKVKLNIELSKHPWNIPTVKLKEDKKIIINRIEFISVWSVVGQGTLLQVHVCCKARLLQVHVVAIYTIYLLIKQFSHEKSQNEIPSIWRISLHLETTGLILLHQTHKYRTVSCVLYRRHDINQTDTVLEYCYFMFFPFTYCYSRAKVFVKYTVFGY